MSDVKEETPAHPSSSTPEIPSSPSAIRDHLANERTLLAWARTGLAVMGLGFVVARFGLALRELTNGQTAVYRPTGLSTPLGVLLALCGVAILGLALQSYLARGKAIERQQFRWSPNTGIVLGSTLMLAGMILVVYLVVAS
jgi:putative membrane protein